MVQLFIFKSMAHTFGQESEFSPNDIMVELEGLGCSHCAGPVTVLFPQRYSGHAFVPTKNISKVAQTVFLPQTITKRSLCLEHNVFWFKQEAHQVRHSLQRLAVLGLTTLLSLMSDGDLSC